MPPFPAKVCWLTLLLPVLFSYSVKQYLLKALTISQTSPDFNVLQYKSFENTAGKGEIAPSPFPTVFSTSFENLMPFSSNSKLLSANSFSFEESKICRLGKSWRKMTKCMKEVFFTFSNNVICPLKDKSHHLNNFSETLPFSQDCKFKYA